MIPQCVVSDRYKFICILIAKNATSTLKAEFRQPSYQSYECQFDQIETNKLNTYFTFTLLRDPVTRLLSAYQEISMRKDGQASFAHDPSFFSMPDNQDRFVTFLSEVKRQKWDPHIIDQQDHIRDKRLDFLGTVETFDRSMTYVFDRLGIPDYTPLPKRRSREGRKSIYEYSRFHIVHVDDLMRSIIQNLYPNDVDLVAKINHAMNVNPDIGGSISNDAITSKPNAQHT